ncbi:MAG: hypothetical protein IKC63_00200 [Clostridia bacterium]|nr:hypothetical protein [Clostridia bacterium]
MAYRVDANIKGSYVIYRNMPLVREGNLIYYGDMDNKYVLFLMILTEKEVKTPSGKVVKVPENILGQILLTDPNVSDADRMVKMFTDKQGLYAALDFGITQLDRYNKKSKAS